MAVRKLKGKEVNSNVTLSEMVGKIYNILEFEKTTRYSSTISSIIIRITMFLSVN